MMEYPFRCAPPVSLPEVPKIGSSGVDTVFTYVITAERMLSCRLESLSPQICSTISTL